MSYLALARKWRPKQFDQVVGQQHVLKALENALAQNRLHHAYLFSGTRGVGKTTIGRLFAKGLNCESGITATPCGHCRACREIDEGRFVDLLEIDAASRTKVEDTRELLDNVQYKPARGRFKVYLIDEVHMLSRHSFNALLKTLEEPPEYVKFLLATTDPQKLPVTILSRCLQFHLKPIQVNDIQQQLEYILKQEAVTADSRALGLLAHAADGSMRDALSLTDQAIALGNGAISSDIVSHMLGSIDTEQALFLLEAMSAKQPKPLFDAIAGLANNGVEWDSLLQQLAEQLHRIAMYQALPATLDKSQPDAPRVELLSQTLSPQDVQLFYEIALKGRQSLSLAPDGRSGFEMTALRMLAFRPAEPHFNVVSAEPQPEPVVPAPAAPQPVTFKQPAPPQHTPMTEPSATPAPDRAPAPVTHHEAAYEPAANVHSAQQSQPEPDVSAAPEHDVTPNEATHNAAGLRHQLRSRRKVTHGDEVSQPKKARATSAKKESVLERVAQQHSAASMSPVQAPAPEQAPVEQTSSEYQWRPSQPVQKAAEKTVELKPSELKQSLEHEKTPQMAQKLMEESMALNEWERLIHQLRLPKLIEQLALNSTFDKQGATISLMLRPAQKHLNNDRAQTQLLQELNRVFAQDCHLSITIGEEGQTPLELREQLYREKLSRAITSMQNDPNIRIIEERFAARLDKESVRPI